VLKNGGIFFFETPNRLFPYDSHDTNLFFINYMPCRIANSMAYALHHIDPSHMRQKSNGAFELNHCLTYWEVLKILGDGMVIISSVGKFPSINEAIKHCSKYQRVLLLIFWRISKLFRIPMTLFLPTLSMKKHINP